MSNLHARSPHLLSVTLACKSYRYAQLSPAQLRSVSSYLTDFTGIDRHILTFQFVPKEFYAMARFNQKQFATVTLEKADEKKLVEWAKENSVTGISSLQDLTADGYKISVTWVDSNQSFCCSLIGTEVSKPNQDAILTSWSDDLEEVIVMSAYKHFVVCAGGEWPVNDQSSRWG